MSTFQNDTINNAIETQSFILDCLITAKNSSDDPTIHDAGIVEQQQVVEMLRKAVAA